MIPTTNSSARHIWLTLSAPNINDHLAGATQAIELLEHLRRVHAFASGLLLDIAEARDKLRELARRTGAGSNAIKETISHVAEKMSLLKLGDKGTTQWGFT
jgi:hypothetical protein